VETKPNTLRELGQGFVVFIPIPGIRNTHHSALALRLEKQKMFDH